MVFVIVLLTIVLVLDCFLLGLLIMVQLPKKEAGIGMAFGGGTADALFGAGSGTALTKLTKYTAIIFFGLVLLLCILNSAGTSSKERFKQELMEKPAAAAPAPAQASMTTTTTGSIPSVPLTVAPNSVPATTTATNTPAAPSK